MSGQSKRQPMSNHRMLLRFLLHSNGHGMCPARKRKWLRSILVHLNTVDVDYASDREPQHPTRSLRRRHCDVESAGGRSPLDTKPAKGSAVPALSRRQP